MASLVRFSAGPGAPGPRDEILEPRRDTVALLLVSGAALVSAVATVLALSGGLVEAVKGLGEGTRALALLWMVAGRIEGPLLGLSLFVMFSLVLASLAWSGLHGREPNPPSR